MEKIKLLSLVIPAYQQEKMIKKNISSLRESLSELPIKYEIIIVVDGKIDKTYDIAKKFSSSKIRVLGYKENKGKGYAVRYGAQHAKGDVIGFIDAGMDLDPTGILMLLNHLIWYDADVIIGSKLHPVSQVDYPFKRRVLSWGYRSLTRTLFGFKVRDTQVGIKIFKSEVVEKVFPRLMVNNFAFDVEVLAVSYALGFKRIYEAPVKLDFNGHSTIASKKFWKVIAGMLYDTGSTFYRLKIKRMYRIK